MGGVGSWIRTAIVVGTLGLSYAAVPLYRAFCRVTGFGGTPVNASPDDPGRRSGFLTRTVTEP